jgi:hypothetical protein
MRNSRGSISWLLGGLLLLAWSLLTGCERPDPQEAEVLSPTSLPPTLIPATAGPTQAPVQVYVVVAQLQIAAPTATPAPVLPTATVPGTATPMAVPEGYYLGWAWTESLEVSGDQAAVDQYGILLRDRPSRDGREVGLVIGFADLMVVGQGRCGYTPVLVHEYLLLSHMSPQPEVATSMPLPTEAPPFYPTPLPDLSKVISGWAYTDELTILGETAISGPLGVNLRSDPCLAATNLGFIPAGTNMVVTGWPSGDYTPVRLNKELLQPPLEEPLLPRILNGELLSGGRQEIQTETPTAEITREATATLAAAISPTVTMTPTATLSSTVTLTPVPTSGS